MNLLTALARLLIFPGLLFAVPAAWFFLWVERKAVALMQQRVGPPFMQPFFDFVKLLGKTTPPRPGIAGALMRAWPLLAVSSAAGAVGLLPVLPSSGGFEGDLILLLALLELPSIRVIAAGFWRDPSSAKSAQRRGRAQRLLQHRLPAGHRLHRGIATHLPAGSARLDAPIVPHRLGHDPPSACPPSCTSIRFRCPTRSRRSTRAR